MSLDFLRHILPPSGVYVGWSKRDLSKPQRVFPTIEQLWSWIQDQSDRNYDTYHACAAFLDARAARPRSHDNAAGAKALWSEADARTTHVQAPYADASEIIKAVKDFQISLKLPRPVWVLTGSGAHWYWPLTQTLEPEAWGKLARALKAAYVAHGVHADPARTADISSVLRTPGTRYHKLNTTVHHTDLVGPYDVSIFEAALEPYHVDAGRTHKPNTVRAGSFTSLAANIYEENSVDPERVADACRQLARCRDTRGALSEPVWRACLGVLVYCRDGEKYGHEWSKGDERYNPAETAGKMQRWRAAADGPATCTHFSDLNPDGCAGCLYAGKITSPIELGRLQPEPVRDAAPLLETDELNDIALPETYDWGPNGELVQVSEKNGVRNEFVIAKHPIYLAHVYETETTRQTHYGFRQRFPSTGWRDIVLPAEIATGSNSSGKLAGGGAAIRQPKEFAIYARHALELKMHSAPEVCYEQFGWKGDNAFLFGDKLYRLNSVSSAVGTPDLMTRSQWLGPSLAGSTAKWTASANRLTRGKPLYQFAVCAGFASAIMPMVHDVEGGILLNLMTPESGRGKTVVLSVVASIWGEWRGTEIKKHDTPVTRAMTCGTLNCLPVCFDEIAELRDGSDPQALHEFVMMFSGGRDKMRATQGGQSIHHTASRWRTFCICTSNHSLIDILRVLGASAKGPIMRIAEFRIPYPVDGNPAEIEALRLSCQENCGHEIGRAHV